MSHNESVAKLASIFRPENSAPPAILLGAGASFSSGIPTAAESVRRIARQYYAERVKGGRVLPEALKASEWQSWLSKQSWFISDEDRFAENFPLAIEHLLTPEAYRKKVLLDLVRLQGEVGDGYRALAELVLRGLAGTVLTTNFDICLPRALNDKYPHIRHVSEVNRQPGDFAEYNLFNKAQIVWLHGKAEQYSDRNLLEEIQALDDELVRKLDPLLESTPLVVIGYRGSEPSIMQSLLGAQRAHGFRQGVYWCARTGEELHPNVQAFAERLGRNFIQLEIDGFDELLSDLNAELATQQRFHEKQPDESLSGFDDRICESACWTDINADLALTTLKRYAEKLELGEIKSETLKPAMRNLGLVHGVDGEERLSNACVLLFGKDTQRFFPQAVVSTTVDGKARRVFEGNLIEQHRDLLDWLDGSDINPTLKVKGKRTHTERKAYADRAIVEMIVNLLVHRDYNIAKPALVKVFDGRCIEFENPSIPNPDSTARLRIDSDGAFRPVPEFSDLRNRALCDVFFGLSAMERAGTGLSDVVNLQEDCGGRAIFAFPPSRDLFLGTLVRAEASAGSQTIAMSSAPIGTYVVNMIPFAAIPATLQKLEVTGGWAELERKAPLHEAGTFVFEKKAGVLWSFAPAALLANIFEAVMVGDCEEIPMANVQEDPVLQRKASWLIRRHFESYLKGFENDGLVLEKTKRGYPAKRAYFRSDKGNNRTIIYDTPKRRGITRDVAKRRPGKSYPWFECEGFSYEVVNSSDTTAIRIKPFYMFTKSDGITPLPGYLRTKRASSRFKFDRNANVDSDLTFWERYLTKGGSAVNLGADQVDDLILESGFFTIDVQETGLLSDDSAAENKRSA